MITRHLIQFTEEHQADYGFHPAEYRMYQVHNINDTYEYLEEDDEGDENEVTLDSISVVHRGIRHVTSFDQTNKFILTIHMDDNCQLFDRR